MCLERGFAKETFFNSYNMELPKISIVTATFNCAAEIEKTIQSVLHQSYANIEYIVIDGASTDGTVDVIKKYADKISFWVSEPDKGLYYAMNKGIEAATGDWVYIFNAGDVFDHDSVLTEIFSNDLTGVDAVYGYIYSTAKGVYLKYPVPFYEKEDLRHRNLGFSHQGVFVRTEWAKKLLFDTSRYRCCADYNMMVQMYKRGAKFQYIDVAVCRNAPAGFSEANRLLQYKEQAIINGVYGSPWYLWHLLTQSLKRWLHRHSIR